MHVPRPIKKAGSFLIAVLRLQAVGRWYTVRRTSRRDHLPDESYVELVTLLISGRIPIAVMGATVVLVGMVAQSERRDVATVVCTASIVALLIARGWIVTAFNRAAKAGPMAVAAVKAWEIRYARIVLPYGALLGLFNLHLVTTGGQEVRLMVVAEAFGFCSGIIARSFVRPQLCTVLVMFGALPTALGFFVLAGAAGGTGRTVYVAVASLFTIYALASLETISHLYGAIRNQLATKRELGAFARVDPLTGLPNRLAMREMLVNEPKFALLLIDLDGFKAVNDRFGHPTGDRLLREVGRRLTEAKREHDLAARIGGDEFCVIQTGKTTAADAEAMARRLIGSLGKPYSDEGNVIRIGSSIGIAMEDGSVLDIDQLVKRADVALYDAKNDGGDTLRFWQGRQMSRPAGDGPTLN